MPLRDPTIEQRPWRLDAPDSVDEWPESRFGRCDVPSCQGWMLRHLPVCREHARLLDLAVLQRAHDAVEDWDGTGARPFPALERYIRDCANRTAEILQ